jgi:hypothetical protein
LENLAIRPIAARLFVLMLGDDEPVPGYFHIWYVDLRHDCAARMTLSGKFYVVPTYSQKQNPGLITTIVVGKDDDLWFTETGKSGLGWIDPATM